MPKKPRYEYRISVFNMETEEEIAHRSSSSLEVVEQSLPDTKKWIQNWEKEHLELCYECNQFTMSDDISYPSVAGKTLEHGVCQDCVSQIIGGEKTPRED